MRVSEESTLEWTTFSGLLEPSANFYCLSEEVVRFFNSSLQK